MWQLVWSELTKFPALVFVFLLPSCLLGLVWWRRLPPPFRVLVVYLWFNLVTEIGSRIYGHYTKNNLPLLHVYTFGEMLLWSLFYRSVLHPEALLVRYFKWITGIVLLAVLLNTVFLQGPLTFNSYAKTLVQLLVILYALSYAFNFLLEEKPDVALQQVLRPVNAAVLLYYCGSLFIFMFSTLSLSSHQGSFDFLWKVNVVLNVIFQSIVLFSLCRLLIFKPRKLPSSSVRAS